MKIILLLFSAALFLSGRSPVNDKKDFKTCAPPVATCYGYDPCNACKTCSACKHCNAGGTCGICQKKEKPAAPEGKPATSEKKPSMSQPVTSGRCKATTKKGTRCSRSARSSGYCWQHE